jgi:site-specific DNA-methyltransferase (adenine-specific)
MARKPLDGSLEANYAKHGTGALNIDGCRVAGEPVPVFDTVGGRKFEQTHTQPDRRTQQVGTSTAGRWPANLIHDGSDEVVAGFPQAKGQQGAVTGREPSSKTANAFGEFANRAPSEPRSDTGSAARFFYCAKASKRDRDEGLEHLEAVHRPNGNKWTDQDYRVARGERPPSAESGPRKNIHPTVKPTDLMRYLCRLVTPPGGVVLDPFMGSGSTGKAAMLEGFRFIGIEREAEYVEIAKARIAAVQPKLL